MEGALLLDVVIAESAPVLELLPCKDESLLVGGLQCGAGEKPRGGGGGVRNTSAGRQDSDVTANGDASTHNTLLVLNLALYIVYGV